MKYTCLSDAALIQLHREGDQKAFSVVFGRYKEQLTHIIFEFTRNASTTEDILGEVVVKVLYYLKEKEITIKKSVYSWLMTIAQNTCIDEYRSLCRKPVQSVSYEEMVEYQRETTHNLFETVEHKELLSSIFQNLSPERKKFLLLNCFYGFTYKEIAQQQNVLEGQNTSEDHIKYVMSRTRRYIQENFCPY